MASSGYAIVAFSFNPAVTAHVTIKARMLRWQGAEAVYRVFAEMHERVEVEWTHSGASVES